MGPETWILPVLAWLTAPLLQGIINRVKAGVAGRHGQPILQTYYDILKLLRKGTVYSQSTSSVFRLAPVVILAIMLIATCVIPWGSNPAPLAFTGDFIMLAYLLGLARFASVLAALDTGSSFEGMGASREVQFGALTEPSLLLGMLVLAFTTGGRSFTSIAAGVSSHGWETAPELFALVGIAFMILLLAENSRIPVDDPNTHLELTMIHEVMILDTGGPDLGMILTAAGIKLWIFCAVVANLVPVRYGNPWIQAPAFLATVFLVATGIGVVESVMARLRMTKTPKFLLGAGALVAIALIMSIVR